MSEILFRGKNDNEEWVYGWLGHPHCYNTSTKTISSVYFTEISDDLKSRMNIIVDYKTIGQYTGLQDKNGKRIFEGDIFKFPDEVFESFETSCGTEYNSFDTENYGVVGFCEFTGRFDFVQYRFNQSSVDADLHENHNMEFHDFVCELEVIGNIHDNPDLLEVNHEN